MVAKGKDEPVGLTGRAPRARLGVDLGGAGTRAAHRPRPRRGGLLAGASSAPRRARAAARHARGRPGDRQEPPRAELWEVVDGTTELITWRQGRSLPYGEGVAFWALAEIVKAQAGILESTWRTSRRPSSRAPRRRDRGRERAEGGSSATCVRSSGSPATRLGRRAGEATAAWRRFFEGVAERGRRAGVRGPALG